MSARTPGPNADAVARGKWVFHAAGCALCHGKDGTGGVDNANSETGGKITGLLLVKEGYSAEQLEERIVEGVFEVGKGNAKGPVPPLRMPAYGKWLTKRDVSDLVAYVFSLYPKDRAAEEEDEDEDESSDEKKSDSASTKKTGPAGDESDSDEDDDDADGAKAPDPKHDDQGAD